MAVAAAEAPEAGGVLSLEEAVGRLPREVVELFEERLRGQFREVRPYRPPSSGEAEAAGAPSAGGPTDAIEALGEDEEE